MDWGAAISAPFVEELYKALGIVLLISIARDELDDVLDGFVWGAMVGIGFLLVEDVFYFVRAFGETGSMVSVFQMFLIRILGAGPYSHFLYTGLTGMGIAYWYVRQRRLDGPAARWSARASSSRAGRRTSSGTRPCSSDLLGDGSDIAIWVIFVTAKGLPMLIGLAIVVRLARRREERWFAGARGELRRRRGDHRGRAPGARAACARAGGRARPPAREKGPAGERLAGRSSARSWSSR